MGVARKAGLLSEKMKPEEYARSRRRGLRWALTMSVLLAIYIGTLFLPS